MGTGGQPRYVVAYTLKQTPEQPPPTQQKQPDILNPDSLQSLKDLTKLKSPTSPNGGICMSTNTDYSTMYSSMPTQFSQDHTDGISIDNTILETAYPNHHNFFIQPPHYSILGNSGVEPPHEYAKNYSTIIVSSATSTTSSSSAPYQAQTNTNQISLDYSRLPYNADVDPSNLLISSHSNSNILLRSSHNGAMAATSINNEYRYSGSDFSMNESNTSTLGSKSNNRVNNSTGTSNRSHIITDTLPGPESCV